MLHSQSSVDDCTELTITEYLRACRRGIGPTACKDSFDFPVLFPFILDPPIISLFGVPVSPIHILVLNVWWVTREIETSAARTMHVTVDRTARVVTWLLPASKRDPYAAGEARSHGCACVTERSPACPYHAMIDYLAILVEKFGETFNVPSRSLPMFADGFGNTLTKSQVVSSYRETLRKAVVSTDGKGIQRGALRVACMSCHGSGVVVRHLERIIFGSIVRKVGLNGGGKVRAGFSVSTLTRVHRAVVFESASAQAVERESESNI